MLFPLIIIGLIGIICIGSGIWMIFFAKDFKTTSDINRVFIFGFCGAAILRTFFKPRENTWSGWQKNVLGCFLLIIGLVCLYNLWVFLRQQP